MLAIWGGGRRQSRKDYGAGAACKLTRQPMGGKAMCELCRRNFIAGMAAFGTAAALPSRLLAQAENIRRPPAEIGTIGLPPRGEFVLRNAHVMTMDASLGHIPGGSLHVRNGGIFAVGRAVEAPRARPIAGDDTTGLPRPIGPHWHMR